MPYKRKYRKKKYSRRRPRKKFRRPRRRGAIRYMKLNTQLIPDQTYVKLVYHDIIQEDSQPSNTHLFRLNSIFDPDFTGVGGQPLGVDQWRNFYTDYQCTGSSIKVTVLNASSSQNSVVAVFPSSVSTINPISDAIEQPYSRYKWVGVNTGMNRAVIKNYMSVKRLEARSTDSINYAADFNANPTITKFWHIAFASADGVANVQLTLDVRMVFYCKLFRRRQLTAS